MSGAPAWKLLVANRGEIAVRIFRSCQALGIGAVAIYSEADARSCHVEAADESRLIGPPPARESYLVAEAILAAARETGAQAIHPGYGFLAENPGFAEAVAEAGLRWIGPSPAVIRQMGDKQAARELAEQAGVPVVPGSCRFPPDALDGLDQAAAEVGYPLLVKAVAGGGGIGMARVETPEALSRAVATTQSMAAKSFGDGTIFLERFIPRARHVEVQLFGFGDGRAIHLYERDCSLQRRFQKVIEESPAPGLPEPVRQAMCEAALKLARAVRYEGAGTVEFIVDAASFDFFFLEMNTRIQVEHPVTEEVAGVDLVAMQIEQARGTLPGIEQDAISCRGHAIECRLYAENPARMFMPSPGRLTRFQIAEGPNIRIDSGFREGDEVTPYYDPMLAKLIAWGEDREQARTRALSALRASEIEGVKTNRAFLIACLEDEEFRAGNVHTGLIDARRNILVAASLAEAA